MKFMRRAIPYQLLWQLKPLSCLHILSSLGLVLHDKPAQGEQSNAAIQIYLTLKQALADHDTAVLHFQNILPLGQTHSHSKEAQMTEIKFSASIWNKNKVSKQLCQHNQKVPHSLSAFSPAESNS